LRAKEADRNVSFGSHTVWGITDLAKGYTKFAKLESVKASDITGFATDQASSTN